MASSPGLSAPHRTALRPRAARPAGAIFLAVMLSTSLPLGAHPFLDSSLEQLNSALAAQPDNPRLHLSRGGLYLDERHTAEALADFDRALALDPTFEVAHLLRAQALLAGGQLDDALDAARRFRALVPGAPKGWLTLARIEAARGAHGAALTAYDGYLVRAAEPAPDHLLERAAAAVAAGDLGEAIAGLERAIALLGPLTAFLERAIALEIERGNPDAALVWLERLAASSPRAERWHLERARLLFELDRDAEARAALRAAEAALGRYPESQRAAGAVSAIAVEIRELASVLQRELETGK